MTTWYTSTANHSTQTDAVIACTPDENNVVVVGDSTGLGIQFYRLKNETNPSTFSNKEVITDAATLTMLSTYNGSIAVTETHIYFISGSNIAVYSYTLDEDNYSSGLSVTKIGLIPLSSAFDGAIISHDGTCFVEDLRQLFDFLCFFRALHPPSPPGLALFH